MVSRDYTGPRCKDCDRPIKTGLYGSKCIRAHQPERASNVRIPAKPSRRWRPDITGQTELDTDSPEIP